MEKTKFEIQLLGVVAFMKAIAKNITTFSEFDGIVRATIDWKKLFVVEEDFSRLITKYGGLLN
jgi:hypothetical protein